jgi:DNA-binding NarL/FixJ family response regulator
MRYRTGEPSTALATDFGVAKTTILGVLRENNVVMRRQSLTSEQFAEAAKLYTAGSSLSQVAAELNLKQDTVRLALKAGGVQLRPRTGG